MFLPNLAPMCLEVIARSAEVYERGQGRGLHERRSVSGVIETCKGHAGVSVNPAKCAGSAGYGSESVVGLGWYRSLPDGPSCVISAKCRIAPIIGHVSAQTPDFGAIYCGADDARRAAIG